MGLSKSEVSGVIEKLREKYNTFAVKYNSKWFDIGAFEERLLFAKRNKMKLEGFVLAEISNFEKLREKYEKKNEQRNFSNKVDKIIEENNAKIVKYNRINFHAKAGFEISHFYGAMENFLTEFFPLFWIVVDDKNLKDIVFALEERLDYFASKRGSKISKRVDQHVNVITRIGVREIDIEKDRNDYLKESAFFLHEIIDFCDVLIASKSQEFELPLNMSRLMIEEKRKKAVVFNFQGLTGYGAIFKVRDQAYSILEDFRLTEFKKIG
jgi:hypothetical protein